MWALLGPLFISLFLGAVFAVDLANNFAHKASEQVRLDAVSLSVCHGRLNFLREIFSLNDRIQILQRSLSVAAPTAISICSNPFTASACPEARAAVKAIAASSQVIQVSQDVARARYLFAAAKRFTELIESNELARESIRLSTPPLFGDLKREEISETNRNYESYFSIRWPQRLVSTENFESVNTFRLSYQPERNFALPEIKRLSANAASPISSRSACSLQAQPRLKVRRLE